VKKREPKRKKSPVIRRRLGVMLSEQKEGYLAAVEEGKNKRIKGKGMSSFPVERADS